MDFPCSAVMTVRLNKVASRGYRWQWEVKTVSTRLRVVGSMLNQKLRLSAMMNRREKKGGHVMLGAKEGGEDQASTMVEAEDDITVPSYEVWTCFLVVR
jgi:hypothetical protein